MGGKNFRPGFLMYEILIEATVPKILMDTLFPSVMVETMMVKKH